MWGVWGYVIVGVFAFVLGWVWARTWYRLEAGMQRELDGIDRDRVNDEGRPPLREE